MIVHHCRIKWKDDGSISFAYPIAIGSSENVSEALDSQIGYYVEDDAEFEGLKNNDPNCDFIVLEVEETIEV